MMSVSASCRLQFLKLCFKPPPHRTLIRPLTRSATSTTGPGLSSLSLTPLAASLRPSVGGSMRTPFSLLRRRLASTPKNTPPPNPAAEDGPPPKLTLFQKFKVMYRDYWYVLVPVHVVTSAGWLGGFYYLSQSGIDIGYYMKKVGFSESLVNKASGGAGHLAIAYAMYKIATPARYAVTLGGTTLAINSLRNLGYITPAREIIQKNRAKLRDYAAGAAAKSKEKK